MLHYHLCYVYIYIYGCLKFVIDVEVINNQFNNGLFYLSCIENEYGNGGFECLVNFLNIILRSDSGFMCSH